MEYLDILRQETKSVTSAKRAIELGLWKDLKGHIKDIKRLRRMMEEFKNERKR